MQKKVCVWVCVCGCLCMGVVCLWWVGRGKETGGDGAGQKVCGTALKLNTNHTYFNFH